MNLSATTQQPKAALIIGEKCQYCSRHRNPREVFSLGTGGVRICLRCLEWHRVAIRALCGAPPPGCQECGVTFADLKAFDHLGNLRMTLVVKDGIYQILCTTCSDAYERQRADLFRDTVYGRQKGI